jgi:hypothetical protein
MIDRPTLAYTQNHLSELHASRITSDTAVGVLVARVADQLLVPHSEIVSPISPLWEHRNC